jgi:hypothetical protein
MNNSNHRFTVLATFSFIACACLFAMSTWGQVKVENQKQNPSPQPIKIGKDGVGGNRPPETLESKVGGLINRVEALEAENKTLKAQVAAMGQRLETHTHKLSNFTGFAFSDVASMLKTNHSGYWILTVAGKDLNNFATTAPAGK